MAQTYNTDTEEVELRSPWALWPAGRAKSAGVRPMRTPAEKTRSTASQATSGLTQTHTGGHTCTRTHPIQRLNKYAPELADPISNSGTVTGVVLMCSSIITGETQQAGNRTRWAGERARSFPTLRRTKDCYIGTRKDRNAISSPE